MLPINIKIRRSPKEHPESPNVLNLNEQSGAGQPKNSLKKYLWLLAVIVLAEALTIGFFYLKQPTSPYFKIIPKNIIAVSYFNQTELNDLLKSIRELPAIKLTKEGMRETLSKTKIEPNEEILKIFQDQMAFVVLPENGKSLNWMLLAQIRVGNEQSSALKEKTEKQLKQNYNLTNESYRQVEIIKIQNLDQGPNKLYYSLIKNYFILTSDIGSLKESIDQIIN